jgi:hypothetical protein
MGKRSATHHSPSPQTRIRASNCRASPQTEAKRKKVFLVLFFQKKNCFLPLAFLT